VEDGFESVISAKEANDLVGRNPYCSGRWFRIVYLSVPTKLRELVVILIVVEDGFELRFERIDTDTLYCRNPYCSGRWFRILIRYIRNGMR